MEAPTDCKHKPIVPVSDYEKNQNIDRGLQ